MGSIGDKIRQSRKGRGWKQDFLADRAGISQNYLSELESGKRTGTLDVLQAVADALEIPISDLVDGNRELPPPGIEPAGDVYYRRDGAGVDLTALPIRLVTLLTRAGPSFSEADWARIIGYVERLAEERGG